MSQMSAILSCFGIASASQINSSVLQKLIRVCSEDVTTNISSAITEDKESEMKQVIQNAVEQIEDSQTYPFTQLDTEQNIFVSPVVIGDGENSKFAIIAVKYDEDKDGLDISVIVEGREIELDTDSADVEACTSELVEVLTSI